MIRDIKFENYRCYESSRVSYKELVVIVGKNNAGKSTMIEALRMIAFATRKAKTGVYKEAPAEFDLDYFAKGIRIDVEKLKIDLRGIVYLYEDKLAKVTVRFDNGTKIEIAANKEIAMAFIFDKDNRLIKTKAKAREALTDTIAILPQIGLIKENEKKLEISTVENYKETYLSSRHFRNEMLLYKQEYWASFVDMAQRSWEGLEIKSLDYNELSIEEEYIQLMVSDNRFVGEIGLMGSGLQMWLQIIWFICRSQDCDTIILDEPDVYMHPDLQIKLLSLVQRLNKQIIIATHSIEIISGVEPKNIIMVDKKSRNMKYANSLQAVQEIVEKIGGVQNMALIRIGLRKKCLFVEGQDKKLLSDLFASIYPERDNRIATLPSVEFGGFSNFNETFGIAKLFYSETEGEIKNICILDRDYYTASTLQDKQKKAEENHLILHIWRRKEIENYLIIPEVLYRLLGKRKPLYEQFLIEFEGILDDYKEDITDWIADKIREENMSLEGSTCNKQAREYMRKNWITLENKIALVPGKDCLSKIRKWIQEKYHVSCSNQKIIKEIDEQEISQEILDVFELLY